MKNKILIIEDNLLNLEFLEDIIQNDEITIYKEVSGNEGIALINKEMPDLILLDIGLPDISGLEVCDLLKKNEKTKNIPVIFLTAYNSKEDIIQGFKRGASDYIAKPFSPDELLARIKSQLNIVNLHNELKKSEQKYKNYIDNTPTGVIVINKNSDILGSNPAFNDYFEYSIEDVKKLNFKKILHEETNLAYDYMIEELTKKQKTSGKIKIITKNNIEKWISVDGFISDSEKIVFFFQDITQIIDKEKLLNSYAKNLEIQVEQRTETLNEKVKELKILEKKLKKLLKNEKEINKLKSNIVTTVSHDFRTPLSIIQSSVELIQMYNEKLDETKRKNLFDKIFNTISSLLALLNNMLLINKLENEKVIVQIHGFNLKTEILKITEELELLNSLKIHTTYTGNELVNSDKAMLSQIIRVHP